MIQLIWLLVGLGFKPTIKDHVVSQKITFIKLMRDSFKKIGRVSYKKKNKHTRTQKKWKERERVNENK